MREILLAGKEPHERAPFRRSIIADRPTQDWIRCLNGIQHRAERGRSGHLYLHFIITEACESAKVSRENHSNHDNVCTSTETTGGRLCTIAFHESPPSADA